MYLIRTVFAVMMCIVIVCSTGYTALVYGAAAPKPVSSGFVLTKPLDGDVVNASPALLTWKAASGATGYTVYLSTSTDELATNKGAARVGTTTATKLSVKVKPGLTYYWYVAARGTKATTTTSDVWSFMVRPTKVTGTGVNATTTLRACSPTKVKEILAQATTEKGGAVVDCDLTLAPSDVVTKRLSFIGSRSSSTTLDCAHATINAKKGENAILIKSGALSNDGNDRIENVTIKNCSINGNITVGSVADAVLRSQPGYTPIAQVMAPRNITLNNLQITANGTKALHIFAGVTETTLMNSSIKGWTDGDAAIYFSPESARNTLKNNIIAADTGDVTCYIFDRFLCFPRDREMVALDGSAQNLIVDNTFGRLKEGGIYLYRNCGENGYVRQQTPYGNKIINNVFNYAGGDGGNNPAIWLGSRNGNRDYCNLDKKYNFGSGKDDRDFAIDNVVYQNQFTNGQTILSKIFAVDLGTSKYVVNTPNYIKDNTTVPAGQKPINRKAGCYIKNGYPSAFVLDGEVVSRVVGQSGTPVCSTVQYTCNDGGVRETPTQCTL